MISWRFKTRDLRPIGLDIGHNSVKMIQLLSDGNRTSVLAANKVRIDPGINGDRRQRKEFVISAIERMLAEGNFRGRNVVSCLSNDELKVTSLRLPEGESGEIERALKKEVAQRFGLEADKDAINYVLAGSVRQGDEMKNELILFAAEGETLKNHIEMLEEARLIPVAIDTVPCALFRSFERSMRRQEDRERTVVFVDVGSRFTTVVFGRGYEISFVKQIPIGGDKFSREVAAKLGISVSEAERLRRSLRIDRNLSTLQLASAGRAASSDEHEIDASTQQAMIDAVGVVAEELAREISLCFRYYTVTFRGKRVEQAVFAGGGAYETILLNVLKRRLAVEIRVAQPLRGFDLSGKGTSINFDSDRRGLLCEWAVAVGLGLKGCNGAKILRDGS